MKKIFYSAIDKTCYVTYNGSDSISRSIEPRVKNFMKANAHRLQEYKKYDIDFKNAVSIWGGLMESKIIFE